MTSLTALFYVPFAHLTVNDWDAKKKKLLDLSESTKDDFLYAKDDYTNTNYHKDSKRIIPDVSDILDSEIQEFLKLISVKSGTIKDAWFEKSSKGDRHDIHNHGPLGYSSVCFINYDQKEHTPTQFVAPFLNFLTGLHLTQHAQVEEGSIIFFPSAILHYTHPNLSDKERLILSFNLGISEEQS